MKHRLIAYLLCSCLSAFGHAAELTSYTASQVVKANQLVQTNKIKDAIQVLKQVDPSRRYDRAYIARMLGVLYWQNGQFSQAITSLTRAVESGELNDKQAWATRKMLADLMTNQQQYHLALPHYYQLTQAIPTDEKGDALWLRISQLHFQLQEWQAVLDGLQRYSQYPHQDAQLPLSLQLGAQLHLEQWSAGIITLKRLLVLEPQTVAWWRQRVSLEIRLGRIQDALSTLALAQMQHVQLSQQDLHLLAQLYAQNGIPERAAQVMESLDNADTHLPWLTERANYWQRAKEAKKAISAWRLAASQDAQYYWPLAQLLLQEAEYSQALVALEQVQDSDKQAQVALAKTHIFYKLNQLDRALVHARQANDIQASESATQWIEYLTQRQQMQLKSQ